VGTIEIARRADSYVDRTRKYKLMVDGQRRGAVRRGDTLTVDVPAGRHVVALKIDWAGSREVTVDVPEGGVVKLWCEPAASAASGLAHSIFNRHGYIELRPAATTDHEFA
jgi:hypothetical protein